jgi:RecA-family ATPase
MEINIPACKEIIIAADADKPGEKAANNLARRILTADPKRIVRIVPPERPAGCERFDWNEALLDGRKNGSDFAELRKSILSIAPVGEEEEADKGPVVSAQQLRDMTFEPIKYVVPNFIVEGLTLLAGKPKMGKSWLMLDISVAVTTEGEALGVSCGDAGSVLYCALEDNLRRLQWRMNRLLGPHVPWPSNLDFRTEGQMKRLNEGGLDELKDWIKTADRPRLIIIDTFAMVRAAKDLKDTSSSYDSDYNAVKDLRTFAARHGVAVILVHHTRKAEADDALDTVSGTLGLTGAPDTVIVLKRQQGGVTLYGRGRDIDELEKALSFDREHFKWQVRGDAAEVRVSDQRKAIVKAIREAGKAIGPKAIAEAAGMRVNNVSYLLNKMVQDEQVHVAEPGKYLVKEEKQVEKVSSPKTPKVPKVAI